MPLPASSTMTRHVVAAPPELSLQVAWDAMQEHRIRHMPVVKDGRLVGLLSDRDVLRYAQALDEALLVPDVPVGEVMTLEVLTCAVATPVSAVARTFIEEKIDAMPVVDAERRLLGLVTSTDLLSLLTDHEEAKILPFHFRVTVAERARSA